MKKLFAVMLACMLSALTLVAFAAEEPKVTCDDMAYLDFNKGNNENDGLTAATAKKALLQLKDNGVVSLLPNGGTLVVSGKMFIAGSYTLPKLGGTLLITSNDGTTDFNTDTPANNPATSLKMAKGVGFTVTSDVILDDILLFQEYKENNTISVKSGATLVIGEKVKTKASVLSTEPVYMHLYAEAGATLIVKAGTYQSISGEGNIIVSDAVKTIENAEGDVVVDPTTAAANALYSLGLVKGYDDSGSDFRLENTLSRAESIVQIVRFLGAEEIALAGTYVTPFTDVPVWAEPYIGYAYTNKITSGVSATKFNPSGTVSEAQFLTLLLRAMEYSDANGDFSWSDPYALSQKVGLLKDTAKAEKFTRGNAFMACYNALASDAKSGQSVGEKLTAAGVITNKALDYAKRIAAGETITVACVGDSITEGHSSSDRTKYSYPAQLQKLLGQGFKVVNCGKSGAYAMNLDSAYNVKKERADLWYPNTSEYTKLKASKADIVIVMLGTNDARSMTESAAQADFVSSYKSLITDIQSMESKPEVYISTMIPAVGANIVYQGTTVILPRLLRGIAKDMNLPLIETGVNLLDYYKVDLTYHDNTHPTDVSYPALAINFYNEVFGHNKANLEFQKAKDKVVFVSDAGTRDNDGTSPENAVNSLQLAVSMLRETGGTVVVCAPLATKVAFFVECAAPVTITSVYNGVDYRATKNAGISLTGSWTLASEMIIENVNINTVAGQSLNAQYNNLTIGEGVVMTGGEFALNVGYRIGTGALTPADVSCHKDCTVKVASGKWALLRGGNMRANPKDPVGTVDEKVKLSIYVSGGEFTNKSVNANSGIGMNGCEGEAHFEISGGTFAGSVAGIHRTGTNQTDTAVAFGGNMTVKITGGTFAKPFQLYHTTDTPNIRGSANLLLSKAMESSVVTDGFTKVEYVD